MWLKWINAFELSSLFASIKYWQAFLQFAGITSGMPLRQKVPSDTIASESPLSLASMYIPIANLLSFSNPPAPKQQKSATLFIPAANPRSEELMQCSSAHRVETSIPNPCSQKRPIQKLASALSLRRDAVQHGKADYSFFYRSIITVYSQIRAKLQCSPNSSLRMEVWFMSSQANLILHLSSPFRLPSQNIYRAFYGSFRQLKSPFEQIIPKLQKAYTQAMSRASSKQKIIFLSIIFYDQGSLSSGLSFMYKTARSFEARGKCRLLALAQYPTAFLMSFSTGNNFLKSSLNTPQPYNSASSTKAQGQGFSPDEISASKLCAFSMSAALCSLFGLNYPLMRHLAQHEVENTSLPFIPF